MTVSYFILALWLTSGTATSQELPLQSQIFVGKWVINEELSDDTDRKVEETIRSWGGRPPDTGKKGKERYRGGPKEHALYDHISYDEELKFDYTQPEFRLEYDDGFTRVFHDDGRKRVISASGTVSGDNQDFSFASWDNGKLHVESSVRDGGWIVEVFEYIEETSQLKIRMQLNPSSFIKPIVLTRIYDRPAD